MPDVDWGADLSDKIMMMARIQGRSEDEIVRDAIRSYLEQNDPAYLAEARRQSQNAAARGWTEEDQYWEAVAAFNEASPPMGSNAAE